MEFILCLKVFSRSVLGTAFIAEPSDLFKYSRVEIRVLPPTTGAFRPECSVVHNQSPLHLGHTTLLAALSEVTIFVPLGNTPQLLQNVIPQVGHVFT